MLNVQSPSSETMTLPVQILHQQQAAVDMNASLIDYRQKQINNVSTIPSKYPIILKSIRK